jgi:hypothetical protein
MQLGVRSGFLTSFRKQGSFVALGLGGALTILWIVVLAWVPVQLIFSVIEVVVREIRII